MITLGPVDISKNMYLNGLVQSEPYVFRQERTIDGYPVVKAYPTPFGRQFTLGTTQLGNAIQGIWCQHVIDEIKALQELGTSQPLDYHGDLYTVVIASTSDLSQLFQWEVVSPDKKYVGLIKLIEV